mmetsp:Transcript_10439/g.21469  ORF Transcript_10439/g.21469 Transcript_10439/m.21469 type:complete len:107 (+) Transcript_10439:596-916(+)
MRLKKSVEATFFNPATPIAISRRIFNDPFKPWLGFRSQSTPGGTSSILKVLSGWLPDGRAIIPPSQDQAFNQGGFFVFGEGGELRLAHVDRGTGDHVELERVEGVL